MIVSVFGMIIFPCYLAPCKAEEVFTTPIEGPIPEELANALRTLSIFDFDSIVIVPRKGKPLVYSIRPEEQWETRNVDIEELGQAVTAPNDPSSPLYYYKGQMCRKCGGQCCF